MPDARAICCSAQVWLGYQQSLRPVEMGLSLNVDLAATAFLEARPVVEYLTKPARLRDVREFERGISPVQHKKATKAIMGIMVRSPLCLAQQPCCSKRNASMVSL